ncbi:sortase [Microbacteriaceae bacterium VKM Ac-2854]|nr:sortase [Microbacteriaceae bacterium VKM Ac-2854]
MRVGRAVASHRLLGLSGSFVVAALLIGCSTAATESRMPTPVASSTPVATTTPSASAPPAVAVPDVPRQDAALGAAVARPPVPDRIRIDALGLDMTVDPVGVDDDGLMELPPDTAVAGWYRFGPGLGASRGTTVIAAHVDSNAYGLGPFSRLRELGAGAEIVVSAADGSAVRYAVTTVTTTIKGEVPLDALFANNGPARLALVTCGGDFDYDTRHYLSNVLVEAVPQP